MTIEWGRGMATFDPRLYGARWADNYDEWHKGLMDDEGAVAAPIPDDAPVMTATPPWLVLSAMTVNPFPGAKDQVVRALFPLWVRCPSAAGPAGWWSSVRSR
jgi:hypothetical protein